MTLEELIQPGTKIPTKDGEHIEVMAVVKGYIMARRKGCVPFAKSMRDFRVMVKDEISRTHVYYEYMMQKQNA